MNLKEQVANLMSKQPFQTLKSEQRRKESMLILDELNIPKNSEFYEFYSTYYGRNLNYRGGASPIVDPSPPQKSLLRTAFFAREVWEVPEQYILFSTGEGEGGYLYNKEDGTVWDFDLGEQKLLGTDALRHWHSFYEFMVWYLTGTDDEE